MAHLDDPHTGCPVDRDRHEVAVAVRASGEFPGLPVAEHTAAVTHLCHPCHRCHQTGSDLH